MTAAVLTRFGAPLEICSVEVADPQPGEVRVRIRASGVCGSDSKVLAGSNPTYSTPPIVLGHESVGVVDAVGEGVHSVVPGDHALIGMNRWCGRCAQCGSGRAYLCTGRDRRLAIAGRSADGSTRLRMERQEVVPFIGIGSFAEYAVVGEEMLVVIPTREYRDDLALLACSVVTGVGAVRNVADVRPGDCVLVIGCGGVGLNVVQGAVLAGARTVIAVDTVTAKLDAAERLGATHRLLAGDDLAARVCGIEPGGVHHAFDVTGVPGIAATAMAATQPGGTTVLVGSPAAGTVLELPPELLFADRRLRGCVGGNAAPAVDLPLLVRLVAAGRLSLEPLISERIGLEDINGAIERQRAGEVTRSLIVFD